MHPELLRHHRKCIKPLSHSDSFRPQHTPPPPLCPQPFSTDCKNLLGVSRPRRATPELDKTLNKTWGHETPLRKKERKMLLSKVTHSIRRYKDPAFHWKWGFPEYLRFVCQRLQIRMVAVGNKSIPKMKTHTEMDRGFLLKWLLECYNPVVFSLHPTQGLLLFFPPLSLTSP